MLRILRIILSIYIGDEMLLRDIRIIKCPYCGCSNIIREMSEKLHTNGHYNEYRRFECGYELWFSPNFMKIKLIGECLNDPVRKEIIKHRELAVEKLVRYIKSKRFNVDHEFKNNLILKVGEIRL